MGDQPVCIIPARGGSKRLPRKNIKTLAGKPLLGYAIEAAQESGVFDQVVVSSEDEEILTVAREYNADQALERPDELATDTAQVKDVCVHHMQHMDYDCFGLLLTTNPLRKPHHVREAFTVYKEKDCGGVLSLVPFSHPPQRSYQLTDQDLVEPLFGYDYRARTQDLQDAYRHDGSMIFLNTKALLKSGEIIPEDVRLAPYIMPEKYSVDIDEEIDLEWAEFLLQRRDG